MRKILLVLVVLLTACSTKDEQPVTDMEQAVVNEPSLTPEISPTETSIPEVTEEINPHAELPNHGPAPELTNDVWLNADHPLRLKDLRGEVVLLEMWTFG